MAIYEYKVVPAPRRGIKVRGVRGNDDRFALTLAGVMNTQAAEGWEYQRTETLPSEEREGLLSKTTVFQNMMVFRRIKETAGDTARSGLPVGQSAAPAPSPAAAAAVPAADLPASVTDTAGDAAQSETSEQPATAPKPPLTAQR